MSDEQRRDNCDADEFCSRKKAWCGNKEEITFIWLTHTDLHTENKQGYHILKELQKINNYVVGFDEPFACIQYMKSIKNEKIFLIVDGKIIIQLYEDVRSCNAIDSIYIFCIRGEKYQHLQNRPKIAGIFTHPTCLFIALQNGIEAFEKQVLAFSRLDLPQHVLTKDLSRESASFLWFMLLFEVLEAMPVAKKDERAAMLDLCTAYYRDNPPFLGHIDEFRRTYTEDAVLRWYTKSSFVYKLVNKALRIEDVELLFQFRFFIIDLCKQLKKSWVYAKSIGLTEISSTVYRGGKLALVEFDALIPGHLINTNGFLSTTRNIDVALLFTKNLMTHDSNYRAVLFHITIPENLSSLVFADVDHKDTSFPDENEVIFSIGARFLVDRVYVDDESSYLYHIDLTATDDGCEDINAYRVSLQRDLNETKAIFLFGRLLIEIGEHEKASNYFQLLLKTTPKNDHLDIATIHGYLGRLARNGGLFSEAFSHHHKALQLREQLLPLNHIDRAASLNTLGLDYYCLGDFDQAFNYFNRALTIETSIHGGEHGHTNISKILGHLALIHNGRGDRHLALDHLMRALKVEQDILPPQHHYIGFRYGDIASIYASNNDTELAFLYYCRALLIIEKTVPVQSTGYVHATQNLITILKKLVENYCSNNDKHDAMKNENIHCLQEGLDILAQCQLLTQSATARTAARRLHQQLKQNDQTDNHK